ncbi:hypothetical protein [Aliikangiella coralliicola]|uniref:Cadherin domain-containing protein n=1 Tax=Aliikangiella coralliicola TaxID=2592383 RepID=A0A545UEV1_9GAMM|nr:hypothetical protein [Aliikangiella coralliicola]TQV88006.1 hypothetical protein FLL46_09340 [Aliikangiella coralliicola]
MKRLSFQLVAALFLSFIVACGGGGGGSEPPPPVDSLDTTPSVFSFDVVDGTEVSTEIESNPITVSGIDAAATISVSNGEYSIDGASYQSSVGTVNNGQRVSVRLTSSSDYSSTSEAQLTIGGVSATFSVTTRAKDTSPDAFSFTSQNATELSAEILSEQVLVEGIDNETTISITNGEYSIDGSEFQNGSSTINPGQRIQLKQVSASSYVTLTESELTVGDFSATFSSTTREKDETPDSFVFNSQIDVELSTVVESEQVVIGGIDNDTPISISNGEFSVDDGPYQSSADTINSGQTIKVRLTSASEFSTQSDAELTIGSANETFSVVTRERDNTPDEVIFSEVTQAPVSTEIFSEVVTINGIDSDTAISIEDGEYSIDGGSYISTPSVISAGQTVQIKVVSAETNGSRSEAILTIGSSSFSFRVITLIDNYLADYITYDGTDIIFLLDKTNRVVYQWSIADGAYTKSLSVGLEHEGAIITPNLMVYSGQHNRLYLGYESGAIQYIDLNSEGAEVAFANTPVAVTGLAAVGNYLLAEDRDTHYIFDTNGVISDSRNNSYYSRAYAWSESNSRVYYFRDNLRPNDLHYQVIDQETGLITDFGETNYHGDYDIEPPLKVSQSGEFVILGSGDVYRNDDLTWFGSIGSNFSAVGWLSDNSVVTVSNAEGAATLQRKNAVLKKTIDQKNFQAEAKAIYGTLSKMTLVMVENGFTTFHIYSPSDDSDNDGVSNDDDAFPLDPAASIDSDFDGYPDSWNQGYDESESTTGLVLDAYPEDFECYLLEHGDGVFCDYSATMPDYSPDRVVTDGTNLYLLSEENNRIYRWSIADNRYIKPMVVGYESGLSIVSPTTIVYSEPHNRLYMGYDTGDVKYFDLIADDLLEVDFVTMEQAAEGLAAAGNFLMVQSRSGFSDQHVFYDADANQTGLRGMGRFSKDYAWSETNSRLYYFRDGSHPNDVHYDEINPDTGEVVGWGESPYHGVYSFMYPLKVSFDGEKVLTGTGNYFNGDDLNYAGSIGTRIAAAQWMEDGSLVTMTNNVDTSTLQRRDTSLLNLVEQLTFDGEAVAMFGDQSGMVLVMIENGTVAIRHYLPNYDTDGDGVLNTEDDFPDDPAASVDSDHDGYPDEWNAGYDANDSTTGLVLDSYPNDSACYLIEHGDGVTCDYNSMVPNFVPDQIVSDSNFIYLLSEENNRVYRWELSESRYTNPFIVEIDNGVEKIAPTHMTVSSVQSRLYLGYNTGAIRYIDLTGTGEQTPFTSIARAVSGLSMMSNYLRAQNKSGYSDFHYVFDQNGVQTDNEEYYPYTIYGHVWSEVFDKQFHVKNAVNGVKDLIANDFDPATGLIGAARRQGNDYEGTIRAPLILSEDESTLLVGNGDLFSTQDLSHTDSLGIQIVDALWYDTTIVTIQNEDSNTVFKVWDKDRLTEQLSSNYTGESLRLVRNNKDLVLVQSTASGVEFVNIVFGDHDEDGMPAWWETLYSLNDGDASDSTIDSDLDGLDNSTEFGLFTLPNQEDTDSDNLTDGDEVNVYSTQPLVSDSDKDSLSDGDEVLIHLTDPNKQDTDEDTFSDSYEVIVGLSDPRDIASVPPLITSLSQSFEGANIPLLWEPTESSDVDWELDSTEAFDGTNSLRTGNLVQGQESRIATSYYFAAGTLSFQAKVDINSGDYLYFYIDGEYKGTIFGNSWKLYSYELTEGMHQIEWRYIKNNYEVSDAFVARVDLVTFTAQ